MLCTAHSQLKASMEGLATFSHFEVLIWSTATLCPAALCAQWPGLSRSWRQRLSRKEQHRAHRSRSVGPCRSLSELSLPLQAYLSTRRDVGIVNPHAQYKGNWLDFCHMALNMAQRHVNLPLDVLVAPGETQNISPQFHKEQRAHPKPSMVPTQHLEVWLTLAVSHQIQAQGCNPLLEW